KSIAEISTNGYKREDVDNADFKGIFKGTQDKLPIENHRKDATSFENTTRDGVPQVSQEYRE
ncbi:flagellar biosynthesis protein FlgG, partial [Campylobacter jejuni]